MRRSRRVPSTVSDMASTAPTPDTPAPTEMTRSPRRTVRTVNWVSFIGTGVVLGVILGGLLHLLGPTVPSYGMSTSILFFAAFGALIGGLLCGLAGVVADAVISRR